MTKSEKTKIKESLKAYVTRFDSQNKAANSLKDVSSATISQVLNEKWELISDDMWRNIDAQVGMQEWKMVSTRCSNLFNQLLHDAQVNSFVYAITAAAGSGKTFTAKNYASNNPNTYHIVCHENWKTKAFLSELLSIMGRSASARNNDNEAMQAELTRVLKKKNRPLIILDEADKLCDEVLYLFITLYNDLEDYCGIILCATPYLETRIRAGIAQGKKGYSEIYSRVGSGFISIQHNTDADIRNICLANGVSDEDSISEILNDSYKDLRRVKRKIHAAKIRV